MKLLEDITKIVQYYNASDWTVTDIDRLLRGQKKLAYNKYLLGVELGTSKANAVRSEMNYKVTLANVELELSEALSNNQAQIVAKRDIRVKDARRNDAECKAISSNLSAIFNSIDSTLMIMSQLVKYLSNEKAYQSRLQE